MAPLYAPLSFPPALQVNRSAVQEETIASQAAEISELTAAVARLSSMPCPGVTISDAATWLAVAPLYRSCSAIAGDLIIQSLGDSITTLGDCEPPAPSAPPPPFCSPL